MTIKDIVDLFEQLELHLIASLKRNLMRHKKQERDEGGINGVPEKWEAWQAAKIRDVRRFRRENEKILGEYMPTIEKETEKILREQYAEGGSEGFFGTSDEKLNALIHEMQNNEVRVERGCLRYMSDVYRSTILRTATAMNAGGMTLQQAVDEATKDFLAQGINCIRYANGRLVNIASYAEMALRTSNTRAMLMGEARQRERLGIDTVLVSQYGACSDTCLPWQGRVYIDDVFQTYNAPRTGSFGVSRNGKQYMLLSIAIEGGLFHPNCRHTLSTWIEGVSTMPKPMDIKEIERVNKLEKRQRELERRVRKAKRQAAGLTDPKAQKAAKAKVREAQAKLREFVEENGDVLRRNPWRERNDLSKSKINLPEAQRAEGEISSKLYETLDAVPQKESRTLQRVEVVSNTPQKPDELSVGCDDVTQEWLDSATPNSHEVTEVTEFEQDGVVYRVDGVNVQLSYDGHEKEIAELLKKRLGGDVRMMPTVKGKIKNVKTPDYLFRGERYDLKTMSKSTSSRAVYNRIKESLEQADNFILDITNNPLGRQEIFRQIEDEIFFNFNTRSVKVVIVVENGEIVKIFKRK